MSKKKVSIGSLLTSGSGTGPMPGPEPDWGAVKTPSPPISTWDNWNKVSNNMQRCELCMHYTNFRCRRHAPRGQEGWPAVFPTDSCGDHKMSKTTMAERA
jgi:hypothetical protein